MPRYFDKLVGVWAGLLGLAYIPYLPSNAVIGRWVILQVGAALLFCLVKVRWSLGHTLGAALLLYMLAGALFWTVSGYDSFGGLVQWFFGFGLTFCIGYAVQDTRPLWWGLLIGVATSLPFALAQKFGYHPVWVFNGNYGTYLSENMSAEAGVIGVVAAVALRQFWLVPIPLGIAYLSGSRTIFPALIAAALVWVWATYPKLRAPLLTVGFASVPVLLGWYELGWMPGTASMQARLEIWALVLRNLHVFGDGLNSFAIAATGIEFAHNEVLHYAFELGVGSCFLWALVYRALQGGETATTAALVVVLVFAAVWFPLHEPLAGFVAAICAGRLCCCYDVSRCVQSSSRIFGITRAEYDYGTPLGVGALQLDDLSRTDLSFRS